MDYLYISEFKFVLEIFSFVFGTIIGSFLNVCVHRIPKNMSIVSPSSHCPSCKETIKPEHNIPIISYLLLGGKCNNCKSAISLKYPLIELLCGLLSFFLFVKFGLTIELLFYLILSMALVVITFIDLEYMIIPNVISVPGILIGILFNALRTNWTTFVNSISNLNFYNSFNIISNTPVLDSIAGIALGGLLLFGVAFVYKAIRNIEGIGAGDIKLLAMLGAFLGINGVFFIIFIGSLVGSFVGISLIIMNKGNMKYAMPFGPFLSLAAILFIFTESLYSFFKLFSNF